MQPWRLGSVREPRVARLPPALKSVVLLIAVLAAVVILHRPTYGVVNVYYGAGLDLRHGYSPYREGVAWTAAHPAINLNEVFSGYLYPPLLALIFEPLTRFPASTIAAAWNLLGIACALYLAAFLTRLIAPNLRGLDRVLGVAVILAVVLLFGPIRRAVQDEEIDIQLLALVLGAWSTLRGGKPVVSGLLLSLATSVKPMYVLFAVLYVWRREWRAALSALLFGAAAIALPFLLVPHGSLAAYLHLNSSQNVPGGIMSPRSISVFGALARICYLSPPLWRMLNAPHATQALELLVGLAVFVVVTAFAPKNGSHGDDRWNFTWGLAVLVFLLGSPVTENTFLGVAIIPLALIVAPALAELRQRKRHAGWFLALAALYYWSVTLPVQQFASLDFYNGWRVVLALYWFFGLAGLAGLYIWAGYQAPYRIAGASVLTSIRDWVGARGITKPGSLPERGDRQVDVVV